MELQKWSIFSLLAKEFIENLRMVYVFGTGNLGNEAFLVTKEDEVFALGCNASGCLGVSDQLSTMTPKRIEAFSGQKIKGFACGIGPHAVAYTEDGDLYTWGVNGYHQLGNGYMNQSLIPSSISNHLHNKKIIKCAAGASHSLALTDCGEVYAWGYNNCGQIGSGSTSNQSTPRKVMANIGGRKVVDIACGQTSSIAVSDNGEVYAWGLNGNGQLGLGNTVNQHNTCRISALQGVIISKIACGHSHVLSLSDDGSLYAWGFNNWGQLGTGNKATQCTPVKVTIGLQRVVDVAAVHYSHISAAMTQSSKIFMWGQCKGLTISTPIETEFESLHDVFALWSIPSVTYEPIVVSPLSSYSLNQSFDGALDDESTADVTFTVEDRKIHAHKAILKIRCDYFRNMFQNNWKENQLENIEVKDYSYSVFRAFLRFLYTNYVTVSPEDAIGLLELANAYCEPALKFQCQRTIRYGITVENAAMLYSVAIKYQAQELEAFCFRFCLTHMTDVAQTDAFMNLEETTVKNFIQKAAVEGAFKY